MTRTRNSSSTLGDINPRCVVLVGPEALMLAIIGCLAITLACQNVERPLGQNQLPPKAVAPLHSPILLALTCSLDRDAAAISCGPNQPEASAHYGRFYASNLVKNLATQQWSFTAYVQNLLKQSIGTLNGMKVTGVKVFVTDIHATAGMGSVSVANPDGIGNFTAPNQPYFNYNQVVAPNGNTGNKLWQFNVPNTVTAVGMSILVSTDFPAEQSVALTPPDTIAAWVEADTNTGGGGSPCLGPILS